MEIENLEELRLLSIEDLESFISQKTQEYEKIVTIADKCMQLMSQTREELVASINEYKIRQYNNGLNK